MHHITSLLSLCLILCFSQFSFGQCETWIDNPKMSEAENAHSNYRSALKMEDFDLAKNEWQKAYEIAPAADGNRDFHYTDGIKIAKHYLENATDDAEKTSLKTQILTLYDQAAECYKAQAIKVRGCSDQSCYDAKAGYIKGRKAVDMYYIVNSNYEENLGEFQEAMNLAGNASEYILFEPIAAIVVYQFQNDKLGQEEARAIYDQVTQISEYNIANNETYKAYYESSFARFKAKFAEVESDVFDCEYFKDKLKPTYDENPDDPDVVKYVYNKLAQEGCDKADPLLVELQKKYEDYAAAENARIQAEFEANNPGVLANKLYREGDYEGAVAKYQEALEKEEDTDKRAQYYFNIASIQFRNLTEMQTARSNALKAAELRQNWGQPYLLIGDIYAKASKSCGGSDAFAQRVVILAALDKYGYAKSIDAEAASEANRKIGIYNGSKPQKEDAFMRGYKEGQSISTGCWIGERVKLRF